MKSCKLLNNIRNMSKPTPKEKEASVLAETQYGASDVTKHDDVTFN